MDAIPAWPVLAARARAALAGPVRLTAEVTLLDGDLRSTRTVWFAGPDRWRVHDETGLLVLHSGGSLYRRAARRGPRIEATDGSWVPGPELGYLGWGDPNLFLDPEPVPEHPGTVRADDVAGRPAWTLRLVSSGAAPHPLDVSLDAVTGLPVRVAAVGTPYLTEVTSLTVGTELDPSLFRLPVPAPHPPRPDGERPSPVRLRLPDTIPGLGEVGEWSVVDSSGASFVAVGRSRVDGVVALARTDLAHPPSRPLAAASGVSIGARLPRHVYAWHDADASYELLTDAELDQTRLATLQVPGQDQG